MFVNVDFVVTGTGAPEVAGGGVAALVVEATDEFTDDMGTCLLFLATGGVSFMYYKKRRKKYVTNKHDCFVELLRY